MLSPTRSALSRLFSRTTLSLPRLQSMKSSTSVLQTASLPPSNTDWEQGEEFLDEYPPAVNGYCPVNVGDTLGSYRVFRKLGWGMYSTVWLAEPHNSLSSPAIPDISALKLMTRVATEAQGKLHELEFLRQMRDQSPNHPGHAHVLQLKDHFYHQGPHGRHLCLVTEPLFQSMSYLFPRFPDRHMPLHLVRHIARQVVLGLQYLHDECNIIHTDIKPDNILMVAPNGLQFFKDHYVELHSSPETSTGTDPNGTPVTRVRSDPLFSPIPESAIQSDDAWRNWHVKITDLGIACWADKVSEHFTELIQSPPFRAPEVAIGAGWGKPVDIWGLGCTMYELYMGEPLLPDDVDQMLVPSLHAALFDRYPEDLVRRGKHRDLFFNSDGSLQVSTPKRPIYTTILERNEADTELFIDFLRLTFVPDPARRATCSDLLAHPWLNH